MAIISERLQIVDGFSATFSRFIELGEKSSASIDQLNNTITTYIQRQEEMAQATAKAREAQAKARAEAKARRDEARAQAQAEKEEAKKAAEAQKEASRQKKEALKQEREELKKHNQAVKEAAEAEKKLLNQGKQTSDGFQKLASSVKTAIIALGGITAVKSVLNLSDQMVKLQTRIDNINPGHMVEGMGIIYRAAQNARGDFLDMADSITKLTLQASNAFSGMSETTRFVELLNKQFKLSGTNTEGITSTMYNLTQALSLGVLRGEDLRYIFSNSPAIVELIAKKLDVSMGKVKEMANQGQITADIVKNAILDAGDDIDRQFEKFPMTFGDAVNQLKNDAIYNFQIMSARISEALNSQEFIDIMNTLSTATAVVANVAVAAFEGLGTAIAWVKDNANWLVPVLGTIVGAIVAYNVVTGVFTAISAVATAAQWAFNGAIMACPIAWIVAAIVALIAILIAVVFWLHEIMNTGHTVFGDIAGVVMGCCAVIQNVLKIVANVAMSVAEFFVNAWNTAVYNVQMFIYNFVSGAIDAFNGIIDGADKAATALANAFISGVNEAANAIDGLVDLINQLPGFSIGHLGRLGQVSSVISARIDKSGLVMPTKKGTFSLERYETTSIGEAFGQGFEKGAAKGDAVQNNLGSALNKFTQKMQAPDGYTFARKAGGADADGAGGAGGGGKTNVGTVDKVKDVTLSDEDLKIYRDLAERKYMARLELKQLAPNITVNIPEGQAQLLTPGDIADKLKVMLIEQMSNHTALNYNI